MKIDQRQAITILRDAALQADPANCDPAWIRKVQELSRLCAEGVSKTHIAFLGTAMLAKSVSRRADLFAIKPDHADNNPNAFSARTLCHGVLVPIAAELGFSIGVTGREPLNNQPYFRMTRLDDGTPVHAGGRAAFNYMVGLVHELNALSDEGVARAALRAFIAVRRQYQPRYIEHGGEAAIHPDRLAAAISALVLADSEGGRRAQAVVAGLMDVFAGPDRVESGRINDPSRRHPGDVCVRSTADPGIWEKAIEVRDKPVAEADVFIFGKKCIETGAREAALVMVAEKQIRLDAAAITRWANEYGIGITLFHGWNEFIEQALFWSALPKPVAAGVALKFIHERLVAVETSPAAVEMWHRLTRA